MGVPHGPCCPSGLVWCPIAVLPSVDRSCCVVPFVSAPTRTYDDTCVRVCVQLIRKETCWALSNIAAGSAEQVDALLANTELVRAVVAVSEQDIDWMVRKEAAFIICNICTSGQVCIRLGLAAFSSRVMPYLLCGLPDNVCCFTAKAYCPGGGARRAQRGGAVDGRRRH